MAKPQSQQKCLVIHKNDETEISRVEGNKCITYYYMPKDSLYLFYENPAIKQSIKGVYTLFNGLSIKFMESLYESKKGTNEFDTLCNFMKSGKVNLYTLEGENIISLVKDQMKVLEGCYQDNSKYFLHASDSLESGEREVKLISLLFEEEK